MSNVIKLVRRDAPDPAQHPTVAGDYFREPGQTFAQAWRAHIESCLDPAILGGDAEDPTVIVIY